MATKQEHKEFRDDIMDFWKSEAQREAALSVMRDALEIIICFHRRATNAWSRNGDAYPTRKEFEVLDKFVEFMENTKWVEEQ